MTAERTVPSGAVIHLLRALEAEGVDARAVREAVSLSVAQLNQRQLRIRSGEITEAYLRAMRLPVADGFWLRLGSSFSVHNHHLDLSNWIMTGRNFVAIMPKLQELYGQGPPLQSRTGLVADTDDPPAAKDATVRQPLTHLAEDSPEYIAHAELSAASLLRGFSSLLGGADLQFVFRFSYAAPRHAALYREVLGARVEFDASRTEVCYAREYLFRTFPSSDEQMHAFYEQQLDDLFVTADDSSEVLARVENLLLRCRGDFPDMPQLCTMLGVGERALRRALKKQGCTYRQLLLKTRMNRARYYLSHSELGIEAIAQRLGYSDYANFRRAFKAQCGLSPAQYRLENSAERG